MRKRLAIEIRGIVQGVGFRPFVRLLAEEFALSGWVKNTAEGVSVEAEGEVARLDEFLRRLSSRAPALARVDAVTSGEMPVLAGEGFLILESGSGSAATLIAPDTAVCTDCLAETRDENSRRFRYPFTNCTNCGPRFTIVKSLPYDRAATTMSGFALCPDCEAEYHNMRDRRFHAQPNACPLCGPCLFLSYPDKSPLAGDCLESARRFLAEGKILAVKGIGGYHLVCDAMNEEAVARLRAKKYRYDKPFALMMPDVATVRRFCLVSGEEEKLFSSWRAPIVLLRADPQGRAVAAQVAPGNSRLGVMLPYTPLHHLLMQGQEALVMTSGNVSDEPIAHEDGDAFARLAAIADCFLWHDRPIFRRCDDSVLVCAAGRPRLLRRGRGYAPEPLPFYSSDNDILACGGQQKNTFCLVKNGQAFLSQHIGDLHNTPTLESYAAEIGHFENMFDIKPALAAHDLHPGYLSAQYALSLPPGVVKTGVQHHHAHLASVLAENRLDEKCIGVIFDGSGFGADGCLWGGEFLLGDLSSYQRMAHLGYAPMPGGEQAVREPWRMALAYLTEAFPEGLSPRMKMLFPAEWPLVWQAAQKGVNAPLTSGMGRLFDGVAALFGKAAVNYEGQAAIELEQALTECDLPPYNFALIEKDPLLIDWRPVIKEAWRDVAGGQSMGVVSSRFHRGVIKMVTEVCLELRRRTAVNLVALSGGVWQNAYLLEQTMESLQKEGFTVLSNELVPANDGGLALGQAAVACALAKKR
ncbi:MAG: carbamoyltransferase HypF [Clostridiales bacterium]|nr:carbamoyltransferase HypF [Clostridiales bacterium]